MSKKEIPDFTEDLVAFMVQSILTIARFPGAPYSMIPLSKSQERLYGADAKIEAISPIYIQFKRSLAYPDHSTAKFIKERKKLNASCSPRALYFELRAKKPTHRDFQHNILFKLKSTLEKEGKGKAFYTAPLFLNRTAYLLAVHMSSLLNWRPWHWISHNPFINQSQSILTKSGNIQFDNIPILQEHIVIPPHIKVNTHKHRYSYLESGKELCFHSPSTLSSENKLGQVLNEFLKFENGQPTTEMLNLQESEELLAVLKDAIGLNDEVDSDSNQQIIDKWLKIGSHLREEYEIFQFMLIKLKNE